MIEDDPDILRKFQNPYALLYRKGHGAYLASNTGTVDFDDMVALDYCPAFTKKGTEIIMTLDTDNHSLSYQINGKNYGRLWNYW